jgi:hypothetical protein|tara:strand:- start:31 stop:423 length:393 start_codon:yes stop_codon:yes gene_type:complete
MNEEELKEVQDYITALESVNPFVIYIYRVRASEKTGMLFKTEQRIEQETLSAPWGQVLHVSPHNCDDEDANLRKERVKVGNYVSFVPTNVVKGGYPKHPLLQRIGVLDIFDSISEENFGKLIKGKVTVGL